MKIITESKATKIAQDLLDLISSTIIDFECMTSDLEKQFGEDILTRKIGEGFKDGRFKYSLRDRYGAICDRLLNTSLTIAMILGIEDKCFRQAVDEAVGDSRVYNGKYDKYIALTPSEESLELDRGSERWWKPRPSSLEKSSNNSLRRMR